MPPALRRRGGARGEELILFQLLRRIARDPPCRFGVPNRSVILGWGNRISIRGALTHVPSPPVRFNIVPAPEQASARSGASRS